MPADEIKAQRQPLTHLFTFLPRTSRSSAARVVRKPGSTEMVNVPAKKTVKLSAGSKLKAAANS